MKKRIEFFIYRLIAFIMLVLLSPLFFILYVLVKLDSAGPFFFKQKRMGLNKKPFLLYKIRTMRIGSEQVQKDYQRLNQADGPVFKIYNDPRYTKVGKKLSHLGLDELPQLINIVRGEMSFVGPRPFPEEEARRVPKKYLQRFSILPGITSPWVIAGAHMISFDRWMRLDIDYVKKQSAMFDLEISYQTIRVFLKVIAGKIIGKNNNE